jgi:hypothetical protein
MCVDFYQLRVRFVYLLSTNYFFRQHIVKLPEAGQKRMCRNIVTVQRYLGQISGRPETELNRANFFYGLVNKDPDELLALIMERGADFSYIEYTYILVSISIHILKLASYS